MPSYHMGGAEKVCIELANSFTSLYKNVDMITMDIGGQLSLSLNPRVNKVDLISNNYREFIYKLIRYYRDKNPDVVITSVYATGMAAILSKLASRNSVKVVVGAHNLLSAKIKHPDNIKDKYVLKYVFPFLLRFADYVVCVSNGVKEDLVSLTKINEDKVVTIYNPIINDSIINRKMDEVTNKLFTDINQNCKIVISVGRLVPQKGYDILLDAFSIVNDIIDASRLVIIGEGPERDGLEKKSKKLGIDSAVLFLGFDSDPIKYIKRSDLFVMSSRWEGFGNVLVEAMACGCQVVSTDCKSGPSEILDRGKFGLLAKPNDPDDLSRKIIQSLEGGENISKELLISRSMDFSVSAAVDKYSALIDSTI